MTTTGRSRPLFGTLVLFLLVAPPCARAVSPIPVVSDSPSPDAFPLVANDRAASLYFDDREPKVVHIAADLFAADVERVTGAKPAVRHDAPNANAPVVLIGTLGQSRLVDRLITDHKIDVVTLRGQWEAYLLAVVSDPLPGVPRALVIVGSDRRGTAYGLFTLSESIGVSPWYWWADVTPRKRPACYVSLPKPIHAAPAVKYRGIFINDEDWGLQPWAAMTFEPEVGDIGPKTYARVCELLLRLRANFLWPAMHPSTKAFNLYPDNKKVAGDYAIVMGSSHAEPMLRNNVSEWDPEKYGGKWDYDSNRDGLVRYWADRLRANSAYENVYTLGMRGIHDSAMPGGGSTKEKVARLQRVIDDQRALLAQHVNPKVEQVPQIFVPYKEVLPLYEHGLRVPPDVTLVWPDDNHGYLRRLPTPAERQRPGGAGLYYHLSYWGKPEDYLWLCSTPPALVWEELHKAYENDARTLWVVNVGDIKPAEIGLDFFMRLAWDTPSVGPDAQPTFLADFATRTFGPAVASDLAAILDEYYRLNYATKPEHLLLSPFTPVEVEDRLTRFSKLVDRANALASKIPADLQDAYYELVLYPVRCSALMSEKIFHPATAQHAHDQIQSETRHYNEQVAGGKWRLIMSANPRKRPVFQKPGTAAPPPTTRPAPQGSLAFEPEHPTRSISRRGAAWTFIPGLGRSGDSATVLPTTLESIADPAHLSTQSPALEFNFTSPLTGPVMITARAIPTHALHPGRSLRYAVAIDDEPPQLTDLDAAEFTPQWSTNVLRAAATATTHHTLPKSGPHTLKLYMIDPGVVLDQLVLSPASLR